MSWEWYLFFFMVALIIGGLLYLSYEVLKTPDKREKTT